MRTGRHRREGLERLNPRLLELPIRLNRSGRFGRPKSAHALAPREGPTVEGLADEEPGTLAKMFKPGQLAKVLTSEQRVAGLTPEQLAGMLEQLTKMLTPEQLTKMLGALPPAIKEQLKRRLHQGF